MVVLFGGGPPKVMGATQNAAGKSHHRNMIINGLIALVNISNQQEN